MGGMMSVCETSADGMGATIDEFTHSSICDSMRSDFSLLARQERPLRSLSISGQRANRRAAVADGEITARSERLAGCPDEQIGFAPSAGGGGEFAKAAFDHMLANIDQALAGGGASSAVQVLRRDEAVSDTAGVKNPRHYRVPLPARPATVVVVLQRTSGARPNILGSTSCERPSARNHDLRGRDDRLLYEHELADDEDDHREGPQGVPACTDLYVTVDANGGDAAFRISVSFEPVKVALRQARTLRQRGGWEAKVADLRHDVDAREQFEERVQQLKEARRARTLELANGVDYLRRNVDKLQDATPYGKTGKLQRQALRGLDRQQQVCVARLAEERRWMDGKVEFRLKRKKLQELKEQKDIEARMQEECTERQRQWFVRVALATFSRRTGVRFTAYKTEECSSVEWVRRRMQRNPEVKAILRRFVLRLMVRQRKLGLYRNVIKFRTALATYARVMHAPVLSTCQSVARTFLESYAFNREAPTIRSTLTTFRGRVIAIQRAHRRRLRTRGAFVSLFFPWWMDFQESMRHRLTTEEIARQADQESKAREYMQGVSGHRIRRGATADCKDPVPERIASEMPPQFVVRGWLKNYILDMMSTRHIRVKAWEETVQDKAFDSDIQKFVQAGDKPQGQPGPGVQGRPALVYRDMAELETLVKTKVEAWLGGACKSERANRRRLLASPFGIWEEAARRSRLGVPDDQELPARGRSRGKQAGSVRGAARKTMASFVTMPDQATLEGMAGGDGAAAAYSDEEEEEHPDGPAAGSSVGCASEGEAAPVPAVSDGVVPADPPVRQAEAT